jgi:hypothetical protein
MKPQSKIKKGEMAKRLKGEEDSEDKVQYLYPFPLFAFFPFTHVFSGASVVGL